MNIGGKQNRIKRILALLLAVVLCTGDVTAPFGSLSAYAGEETEPSTVTGETAAQAEPLAVSEPETAPKQPETQPETQPQTQAVPETQPETQAAPETQPETQPQTQAVPETQPETQPQTQAAPETQPETQPQTQAAPETQPETQPESTGETQTETQAESTGETQTETQAESTEEPQTESGENDLPEHEASVKLLLEQRYATAGQKAIVCKAELKDGTAPYMVRFTFSLDGVTVHEETVTAKKAGQMQFTYMPQSFGVHELKITVTDDSGKKASAKTTIPVSVPEEESAQDWAASVESVTLTGDWRKDLPAIAATQLGYEESRRNFIIDENGEQQGYTRYGHWYGMMYEEWCAMFVSFCLYYADIPAEWFPREAECGRWRTQLENIGAYEERGGDYVPQKGDLVFFNYDSDGTPDHVGIVADAAENRIIVIAGNENRSVLKREYGMDDSSIAGYANMEHIMDRAGVLEKFEQTETAAEPESVIGRKILTNTDRVNLRELPDVASAAVGMIEAAGTELVILDAASNGEETWYQIIYNGITAWIRSDLTALSESETEDTPESESETEGMSENESETEDMPESESETEGMSENESETEDTSESESETENLSEGESGEKRGGAGEEAQITIYTEQENVKVGEEITFIAEVFGLENAVFQWQCSEDGESWEDIEDETGLSYTTVVTEDNSSYYYRLAALAAVPEQSASPETGNAEEVFAETAGVETASAEATSAETAGGETASAKTAGAKAAAAAENQETTNAPGLFAMRKVMAAEEKKPEQTAEQTGDEDKTADAGSTQQIFSNAVQMPLKTMRAVGPVHLNPKNTPDRDAEDQIVKEAGTVNGAGTDTDPMLHYTTAFEAAKANGSNLIYFWNPYAEFTENGSAEVSGFTGAILDGEGITLAQYTTKHNGYLFEIANNEEDWSLSNMTLRGSYPLIGMLGGKAALDGVEMDGGTIFFEYIDSEFPQKPRLTVSNIPEGDTYVVKFGEYTADTAIAASSKHRAPLIRLAGENAEEMAKQIVLDESLQKKYKLIFRNNTVYVTENNDYKYVFLSADRGYDDDGNLDDIDEEDGLTPYTPVNTMETAVEILRENPDLGGIRVIGKAPEVTGEAVWDMSEFAQAGKTAVERWDGSYYEEGRSYPTTMSSSSPVMCDGPIAVVTETGALTLKNISLTGKNDATLKVSGSLVMEAEACLKGNKNKAKDNSKNESWKPGGAVYADGSAVVTVKSGASITDNCAQDGSSIYATGSAKVTVESGADIVTNPKTYKEQDDNKSGTLDELPRVGSLIYADGNAQVSYSGTITGTQPIVSARESTIDNMAMFYARSGAALTFNGVQITDNSSWRFIICTESGGSVTLEAGTEISGNTGAERIINMGGIIGNPSYGETSARRLNLNGTPENPVKIADNSGGCAVYTLGAVTASYAEITGNESTEEDGYSGLCVRGGYGGTIDHCKINNNTSTYYAGVYFDLGSGYPVTVTNTEISGNTVNGTSKGSVAGLSMGNNGNTSNASWVPSVRIQNCTMKGNVNNAGGFAGLDVISSKTGTVISDTEVTDNQSTGNAGINLFGDLWAVLARTTVQGNNGAGKSGIILPTTSIGSDSVMLALTGDCSIQEGQKVYFGSNQALRLLTEIEQESKISLVLGETADSSYFSVGERVAVPYDGTLSPSDLGYDNVEFLTDVTGEIGKFAGENMPQDPYPTQLAEDSPDIILAEQGIYLDGVNGDDGRTGLTPGTAVKTFERAKEKLKAALEENPDFNPVIIICGTVTVDSAAEWSLADVTVPEASSPELKRETLRVKRYSRVNDTALVNVTAAGSLTASDILWDGAADEMITESGKYGEALILVNGGTLTLQSCTMQDNESLRGNDHTGGGALTASGGTVSLTDTAIMNTLSSRGALYFRDNAQASLAGCTITGNSRSSSSIPGETWADGGGISAESGADVTVTDSVIDDNTTESTHGGHGIAALNATVTLIGTEEGKSKTQPLIYMGIGGKLFLGGALASTVEGEPLEIYLRDTAIGLAEELAETTECVLSLHSDFAGRIVVESNTEKPVEAGQYLAQFDLTEETKKLVPGLSVKDETEDPDWHIWADGLHVYLDGQNGSDENSGSSPENAVKTFAAAKKRLAESSPGANIVICGRVDVSSEEIWSLTDADGNFVNSEGESWQPVIQRYRDYYDDVLVKAKKNGDLTMENLVLDGNSASVIESTKRNPDGLISGDEGSKIILAAGTVLRNQKVENTAYDSGALYTEGEAEIQKGALITDCSNKSKPIVLVQKGGSLKLCGEIENCTVASTSAIVLVGSDSRYVSYKGSALQVEGAYIHDCTASQIICVNDRSWLTGMKDTVIEKNDCGKTGSVVYLDLDENTNKLEMTIQNSMIRDNKGTGVTVYLSDAADRHSLTLNKATITGNINESAGGAARGYPGGGVCIGDGGTVNITDCTIEYNEANMGGGVYVGSTTAQLNISGGSISNNRSKDEGGGICFLRTPDYEYSKYDDVSASLQVKNGTKICNNTAKSDGDAGSSSIPSYSYTYGGGIFAICPNVTIDSSVEISGNFAAQEGGGVYIDTYHCSSSGEVTVNAQITGNTSNNGAGIAVNGSEECRILLNGAVTGNKIREDKNAYSSWTKKQQSAGVSVKGGPVECRADIKDNEGSRGVYVGKDGHLTFSGGEISGHMNGFKEGEAKGGVVVAESSSLVMKGGAVGVDGGGVFEMTDGRITGNAVGAEGCAIKGGAIYSGSLLNSTSKNNRASVIISGGEIAGNAVEAAETVTQISGGAVCADGYSDLTVSGGEIYENALGKAGLVQGGGLYVYAYYSNLTMTGGEIYRNAEGGKIQGGGVHLYGYSSSSSGVCAITGGTIRENGQTGLYETDQSKIENGLCTVNVGGGVYVGYGVSLTVGGDAVISRNTAQAGGGIYADVRGTLTVGGSALITENEAYEGNGGGIYTLKPVKMSGSVVISENRAAKDGGGIYFTDDNRNYTGSLRTTSGAWDSDLNGGYFLYNTAGGNGGALYLKSDADKEYQKGSLVDKEQYVSIHNAYIEGNKAEYGQGIYCDQFRHIRLYGNQAVIEDEIYLRSTDSEIVLAATCQNSNTYLVEVNDDETEGLLYANHLFQVNSTVVTPETITTATTALRWFTVKNASYILMAGVSTWNNKDKDIVLGRCVFIDSVTGSDDFVFHKEGDHTGVNPDKAVKTFAAAKELLGDSPGVIYVSGPIQVKGTETWSLSSNQLIRRYTGFAIGAKDVYPVYEGSLVEVKEDGSLTLNSYMTIDGGSEYLDQAVEGCIIKVEGGGTLTAGNRTNLQNNTTTGCGGAMRIEDGGTVTLNGSKITNTVAEQQGNAIYQDGKLVLTGKPVIEGDIYLGEVQKDENEEPLAKPEEDVIQIKTYFYSSSKIEISLGDAYYTRPVVIYQNGVNAPATDSAGNIFVMAENVAAMYALANRSDRTGTDQDTLELTEPLVVYIDGVNGKDDWAFGDAEYKDGDTPDTAVKTLKRAYELLAERGAGTLFVVNTVTIDSADITITGSSYTDTAGNEITIPEEKVPGGVAIRRYSQPYEWKEVTQELKDKYGTTYQGGYTRESNVNELFVVKDGGVLTIGGSLTVNGHSLAFPSANPRYNAPAVKGAALIRVDGGSLTLEGDALLTRNSSVGDGGAVYVNGGTVTMLAASITNTSAANGGAVYAGAGSVVMPKENKTRKFQSVRADENGGAIYIAEGASAELYAGTEISNASAKEGSAVYQGGSFSVEGQMNVSGEVYLKTDHYIDVNSGGFLNLVSWIIDPENPYEGRDIALYADGMEKPDEDEKAKFPLVDEAARFYYLNNEDESLIENGPRRANMLELQLPHFVYIDGVNGSDEYDGVRTELTIGSTPETAVKTLKKAYELLKARNCPRLYVVDTVTVSTSILLSETRYAGSDGAVELEKEAEIMRYSQPDAADELTGFNRESNENALFKIAEGGNLTLRSMVIDGHSTAQGGNKRTTAPAVEAKAPLIENAGTLRIASGTVLRNNHNAMENGRGGALYVNGGETIAYGGTITGTAASLGSAVYLDGELKIYNSMQLGDLQVYLHSDDTDKPTGSYIYVETSEPNSGDPITVDFPNYVDYRVIAEYSDDLKPNADKYSEDVKKREEAELLKVVEKQQVLLRKYPDEAKQINVTVPLYVCMYAYGGNGKVVTPTEDAYAITSRSNCPVQITSVQATEAVWELKEKAAELKEAGELYLALDGQPVTEEKTDTSKNDGWLIPAAPLITENGDEDDGSGANREPQNLSIQIDAAIAGGNVNEEGEARVCTVTYTVAAAEN